MFFINNEYEWDAHTNINLREILTMYLTAQLFYYIYIYIFFGKERLKEGEIKFINFITFFY